MSDVERVRGQLHETIQGIVVTDDTLPEGSMLLGWAMVAEWMAPDGRRWLSILDADARGEGCPAWQRQGYLHNALFDPDGFIEDDDQED